MSKFIRESQSGYERIDKDAGIIYGVKVLGPQSRNGRVYEAEAIANALPLYEGVSVNLNHQRIEPKAQVQQDRRIEDRWGVLKNARLKDGSIYADLHYLKTHPATPQLIEAAERFPETFGLSHDAAGDEQVIDGKRRVVELLDVRSVDIVADPATNNGLFESHVPSERQQSMESRLKRRYARLSRMNLLEVKDGDGDGKINDGKSNEAPAPKKEKRARVLSKPKADSDSEKSSAQNVIGKKPASELSRDEAKSELVKLKPRKDQIRSELSVIEDGLEAKYRKIRGDKFKPGDYHQEWNSNPRVEALQTEENDITRREMQLAKRIKGRELTGSDYARLNKGTFVTAKKYKLSESNLGSQFRQLMESRIQRRNNRMARLSSKVKVSKGINEDVDVFTLPTTTEFPGEQR
jgi:hypothetical protein